MNLTGLIPRNMYAVDILWPEGYHNDICNGDKMHCILKEMQRNLQRDGFSIEGCIRKGFTAIKDDYVVKIQLSKL